MKSLFHGSGVALVTPFKDGEVDWGSLEKLVHMHLTRGTDALIPCGTTGEPATLTQEEHDRVVSFVVAAARGTVPVIAGSGSNCTRTAAENSKRMQDLGADGVLVVTPYYNKATQEGLRKHFEVVADSVSVPVILYNVPSRTGVNMLPETVAALAEHPQVGGLKEACGDLGQLETLFRLCRDKLPIYSGNDDQVYSLLALGGSGVISVAANIAPQLMSQLVASYRDGHLSDSLAIQEELAPLLEQLFVEVNPIPVKAAMAMMGLAEDELRLPLTSLSEKFRPALHQELQELNLVP